MDGFVVYTVELTVLDGDVVDCVGQLGVVVAHNHDTIFGLVAGHILHGDVAHRGVETTAANLTRLVVGVDLQHSFAALADNDVAHVDILNDTAAARICLDAQYAVEVGRVHAAVLRIHILATATDFASDDHTTVSVLHLAVADDDVLRRCAGKLALTTLATVVVATALDGDAVVTGVEETVFDEHAVARLWVAAVAVRTVIVDMYATHGNVL